MWRKGEREEEGEEKKGDVSRGSLTQDHTRRATPIETGGEGGRREEGEE